MFAGVRTQYWDVAPATNGPTLLELNHSGDLNVRQFAHGAGVRDEIFQQRLQRCGYRGKL